MNHFRNDLDDRSMKLGDMSKRKR